METFGVYQTFAITFKGKYCPLFVTFKRNPNGSGHIYEMKYWSQSTLYPKKLFLEEEELTREEFEDINIMASKLWDEFNRYQQRSSKSLPSP